jgi:hypothetical protein
MSNWQCVGIVALARICQCCCNEERPSGFSYECGGLCASGLEPRRHRLPLAGRRTADSPTRSFEGHGGISILRQLLKRFSIGRHPSRGHGSGAQARARLFFVSSSGPLCRCTLRRGAGKAEPRSKPSDSVERCMLRGVCVAVCAVFVSRVIVPRGLPADLYVASTWAWHSARATTPRAPPCSFR